MNQRSSRVVEASLCQCQSRNIPRFEQWNRKVGSLEGAGHKVSPVTTTPVINYSGVVDTGKQLTAGVVATATQSCEGSL